MPAAKKTPAAKRRRRPEIPAGDAGAAQEVDPLLRRTEWPGVFVNPSGDHVDARGVLLAFTALRAAAAANETEVLGKPAETPAEVLKYAALNLKLPLLVRLEAAKAAAPYYDRKKPTSIDAGADPDNPAGPGLPLGNLADLRGLDAKELAALYALLKKASV